MRGVQRNLTDADILRLVAVIDQRRSHGGNRRGEDFKAPSGALNGNGKSAHETAEKLGVSPRKVERTRAVLDHAPAAIKDAIDNAHTGTHDGVCRAVLELHRNL